MGHLRRTATTLAIDFDGVIHTYSKGWQDGTIYDPPLPGAIDGLEALLKHYAVFVHTTRDPDDVANWLAARISVPVCTRCDGPFWNQRGAVLVTNRKYPAVAYIDDRAYLFTDWPAVLAQFGAKDEKPWGI